ncbi:hypothetical protein, partial [Endozoicomonas sp. SESOKO2]|uniref:hypothetical protein n=1 Tax=Endozoicomonas sp. SESOKO2 TaxID=2828743 RepID=UPI0021495E5D
DYGDRFRESLVDYLSENENGRRFNQYLQNLPGRLARPEKLSDLDSGLPEMGVPKELKLILVLDTPENLSKLESGLDKRRVKVFDPRAAQGNKPGVSGSITQLRVDPTMGKALGEWNYGYNFFRVPVEIMAATAPVAGKGMGSRGLAEVAKEVLSSRRANLSAIDITNEILRDTYIGFEESDLESLTQMFGELKADAEVVPVAMDDQPNRLGFEREYLNIYVLNEQELLPKGDERRLLAFSEGRRRGWNLLSISTDSHRGRTIIELIAGPLTLDEYNEKTYYRVMSKLKKSFKTVPQYRVESLQDFVDRFNKSLESLGDKAADYKLRLNPYFTGNTPLKNITFTRDEQMEPWNVRTQATFNGNYRAIGDPFAMVEDLIYRKSTKSVFPDFLNARVLAHQFAKRIDTGPVSQNIRSFLTHFFFERYFIYRASDPDQEKKTRVNFLFRFAEIEAITSILSDREVDTLDRYFSRDSIESLTDEMHKEILSRFPEDRTFPETKRLQLMERVESVVEAIAVRKKYGAFQAPVRSPIISTDLNVIPIAQGKSELLNMGMLNSGSRLPIVATADGQHHVKMEIRHTDSEIMSLVGTSPKSSGLAGWLALMLNPDALGTNPEATRHFISGLERKAASYAKINQSDFFYESLQDKLVGLTDDRIRQVEDIFIDLSRKEDSAFIGDASRQYLLGELIRRGARELYTDLLYGQSDSQPDSGKRVIRLAQLHALSKTPPVEFETAGGKTTIKLEFDAERSMRDFYRKDQDGLKTLVVGVRNDL